MKYKNRPEMSTMDKVLTEIHEHERVCWYPSAGADFMGVNYLARDWFDSRGLNHMKAPDLFIMTDAHPWDITNFGFAGRKVFDGYTDISKICNGKLWKRDTLFRSANRVDGEPYVEITAKFVENLGQLDVSDYSQYYMDNADKYMCAYLIDAEVKKPGKRPYRVDILYILLDNTVFAKEVLVDNEVTIDYLIEVRYGGSLGGSVLFGTWIRKLLPLLNTKYFVANEPYFAVDNQRDLRIIEDYWPELSNMPDATFPREEISRIFGEDWSDYGDVLISDVNY